MCGLRAAGNRQHGLPDVQLNAMSHLGARWFEPHITNIIFGEMEWDVRVVQLEGRGEEAGGWRLFVWFMYDTSCLGRW